MVQTVQNTYQSSFREKGSKFIGFLFPAPSITIFENCLSKLKSKYPDATHHCYAWRINPNKIAEFTQDDGEPGGTAGLPILNKLKSFHMVNCGCVVVRYYGGTNLGKSGLIRAYGEAAERCLGAAEFYRLVLTQNFKIYYDYPQQGDINRLKTSFDLKELDAEYLEQITLTIACRRDQSDAFYDTLQQMKHLGIRAEKEGAGFITFS